MWKKLWLVARLRCGVLEGSGEARWAWVGGQLSRAWGQAKLSPEHKTGASQEFQAGCRLESSLWGEGVEGDRLAAGGPIRCHCSLPGEQ